MTAAVAVVVPVKNRAELLRDLLAGLRSQTFATFEAVIVDDHSDERIADVFAAATSGDERFRLIDNPGVGAVAARAAGVEATEAPCLAFTDSDCVPDPEWLERGVAALQSGAAVAQGRTEPERQVRPGERSVAISRLDGLYATCNVFYRREAFERAGGFDPAAGDRLGFRATAALRGLGFGEDALVGWRVAREHPSVFAHDAVVRHRVFAADLRESLRRAWLAGAFPALVREVPELRDTFLAQRLFVADAGRLPLYAAAVLALSRRRVPAALAAAVWVAGRARRVTAAEPARRRWPAAVAFDCITDAVAAVALALGSVRSRSTVL